MKYVYNNIVIVQLCKKYKVKDYLLIIVLQMKISCITSERHTHSDIAKHLYKTYKSVPPEKADVLICLGGDGFMLHTLHNYHHLNKPIYGINCGTVGFLLNEYNLKDDLLKLLHEAYQHTVKPLSIIVETLDNKKITELAFNEVVILRDAETSAKLELQIDGATTLANLMGDGLLVATPLGSTAYNRSCRGPILCLDSKLLAITPINPFKPLAWQGAIIKENHHIKINNLFHDRSIKVQFDFKSIKNVKSVEVKLSNTNHAKLLFNKNDDLEKKIFQTQFINR